MQAEGRKALVAYLVAGDPCPEATLPLMLEAAAAGVDIIELGLPFSDPEAEGPVIQAAHERALAAGMGMQACLALAAAFRQQDAATPVVLMGYLNPVETLGYAAFAKAAAKAGIDGTIIVNLPPEEAGDLNLLLEAEGLAPVYLLSPTTTEARAQRIVNASRGFVYYVSLKGTTGAANLDLADVAQKMQRFKAESRLPIYVGFGVKDAMSASAVAALADGVVVGSALVSLIAENQQDEAARLKAVRQFIAGLRKALD